jgi:hypothetical protein
MFGHAPFFRNHTHLIFLETSMEKSVELEFSPLQRG